MPPLRAGRVGRGDAPCCCGCKCGGKPVTRRGCLSWIVPYTLTLSCLGLILGAAGPAGPWLVLERWPNATSANTTMIVSANSSATAYEQRHFLSGRVEVAPLCVTTASKSPPRISRSGASAAAQTSTTTCYPFPSPTPPVLDVGSLIPRVRAEEGPATASGLIVVGVLAALAAVVGLAPLVEAGPCCGKASTCRKLREAHATLLWSSSTSLCILSLSLFFASLAQYNEALTDPVNAAVNHAADWDAYARSEGRSPASWPPTLPEELMSIVVRQGSGYGATAAGAAILLLALLVGNLVVGCLGRRWLLCPSSDEAAVVGGDE